MLDPQGKQTQACPSSEPGGEEGPWRPRWCIFTNRAVLEGRYYGVRPGARLHVGVREGSPAAEACEPGTVGRAQGSAMTPRGEGGRSPGDRNMLKASFPLAWSAGAAGTTRAGVLTQRTFVSHGSGG